jgi:hypothetical protein
MKKTFYVIALALLWCSGIAAQTWQIVTLTPSSGSSLGGTTLVIQLLDAPALTTNPANNPRVFVDGVPATVVSIFQSGRNMTIRATMQPAVNPGTPSVLVRMADGSEADIPFTIFGECPKLWTAAGRFTQGTYPNCPSSTGAIRSPWYNERKNWERKKKT